jgi:hypothetical protein
VVLHLAGGAEPGTELHVAAGIVRHRRAGIRQPLHVVVIDPHRVSGREIRPGQAELVQMADQRGAVFARADERLHL